jgi:ATP-dependent RNA helicase RhlE
MSFEEFALSPALLRAVSEQGYTTPTPVQTQAIPVVLDGFDLVAGAQTGTGKTAAFALPLLERLFPEGGRQSPSKSRKPRVLVLTPTRELAAQVHDSMRAYGKYLSLRSVAIFGGVGMQPQVSALQRGVEVLVATPGRLLDHMQRRTVDLSCIEALVLDEADRMLDMGFLPDVKRILSAVPEERQTLLFSATFADEIRELAARFLYEPVEVQVARRNSAATTVTHRVHPVDADKKRELLVHLLTQDGRRQALVFSRTKHGADRLSRHLEREGLRAAAIHGNKSQGARTRVLKDFKNGRVTVLVATDIAARGLDIEQLPMVINHDLPTVAEDYVHRTGRTGRAGSKGLAISLVSQAEAGLLRQIQRLLNREIAVEPVAGYEPARPFRMGGGGEPARPNNGRRGPGRSSGRRSSGPRSQAPGGQRRSSSQRRRDY